MNLKIDHTYENNDHKVILAGEIDVYTAENLNEAVVPLTENKENDIEIDLGKISYLDSTGLGVFIALYKSAEKHGSNVTLINTKDRVLRLFKITGLDEIIDVRATNGVND